MYLSFFRNKRARFVDCGFRRKLVESLQKLSRLRILEQKEQLLVMNDTFRREFQNALTGG